MLQKDSATALRLCRMAIGFGWLLSVLECLSWRMFQIIDKPVTLRVVAGSLSDAPEKDSATALVQNDDWFWVVGERAQMPALANVSDY